MTSCIRNGQHRHIKANLLNGYLFAVFLFWAVQTLFAPLAAIGAEFPKPTGAVNDFAAVIRTEDKAVLESLAREILQKTGTAVVVATIQTTGERDIREYANDLYSAWGIGKKGEDKGILILVTMKERKMRIETGYGVEGVLPDGLVGEIRDKYMIPYFKQGNYGKGLTMGMSAIGSILAGHAGVALSGNPAVEQPPDPKQRAGRNGIGLSPLTLILLAIAVVMLLATPWGRDIAMWLIIMLMSGAFGRGGGGGGGFGGFGGGGFGGFGGGSSGGGGADGGF